MVEKALPVMERILGRRVIPVLRAAGQMSKPRSADNETMNGKTLPSFRGEMLHDAEFTRGARTTSPERLVRAYHFARSAFDALMSSGSFARGGYVSHEALVLHYEGSLVRMHEESTYSTSSHLLWVGMRTNQCDGPHVEFLSHVVNPIGIKVGPSTTNEHLIALLDKLNPRNEKGKIVLIVRLGRGKEDQFKRLLDAARGREVIWSIDPMHGNGTKNREGNKVRYMETMFSECRHFTDIMHREGVVIGGLHIEAGEGDFTECVWKGSSEKGLRTGFRSLCDPRLNSIQTWDFLTTFSRMAKGGVVKPVVGGDSVFRQS
jgi:3-deoxy-7-phosphoheptulonate synthase